MASLRDVSKIAIFALLGVACSGDDGSSGSAGTTGAESSTGTPADDDGSPMSSTGEPEPGSSSGSAGDGGSTSGASSGAVDSSGDGGGSSGDSTGSAAGPTWDNFAAGFFETYCWECHGPGDALRDYSKLEGVMPEAAAIRCGTAPPSDPAPNCAGEPPAGQFPVGATVPTDEERSTLVEWIDAGLP